MNITISRDFERNKYWIIALYINITLITRLISSLFSIVTRTSFSRYTSMLQWGILLLPLGYFFLTVIVRGIKKRQLAIIIIWAFMMFITRLVTKPQDFLMRQALVEGLSHVVIPAVMIQEVSDAKKMIEQLEKYVGVCAVTCLLQFLTPGLARNAYYSFSYITFFPAAICLGHVMKEGGRKYWISFLIISLTNLFYGGRGFFLCIAVFLVFYTLMYYRTNKTVLALVGAFIIFAIIYTLFGDMILSGLSGRFVSSRTIAFLTGERTDSSRFRIWGSLLSEFAKAPFTIRGMLSDREFLAVEFHRYSERTIAGWYSHNFIVEIIFEFGVVGILILLCLFGNLNKINRNLKKQTDEDKTLLFFLVASLFLGKMSISSSYLIDLTSGVFIGFLLVYRSNAFAINNMQHELEMDGPVRSISKKMIDRYK